MNETFRLHVHTDSDAFKDGHRNRETARILRQVASYLDAGIDFSHYLTLLDINGNDVGRVAFKEEVPSR